MKTKAMGMFALLMIALTVAGFGYAHWSDMVTIEGTVHMGELIVGWYNTTDYMWWVWEATDGKPWVANATIEFSDPETSVHHDPPETVNKMVSITAENVYPQWWVNIGGWLKNAGTIPAKLDPLNWVFDFYDETDHEDLDFRLDYMDWTPEEGGFWYGWGAVVDPVVGDIINFYFEFWVPYDWQLEPCTEYYIYLYIDFKQEIEECHTYTFTVTIEAIQWNKA